MRGVGIAAEALQTRGVAAAGGASGGYFLRESAGSIDGKSRSVYGKCTWENGTYIYGKCVGK